MQEIKIVRKNVREKLKEIKLIRNQNYKKEGITL